MYELYNYQQDGVDEIRDLYKEGVKSVLYVLPTGGGKTVVFTYIADQSSRKKKRVWVLVHRVTLLRQITNALRVWGVHCGMVNPNYTPDLLAPVQVASISTLIRRYKKLDPPDVIIIDEAHHATANEYRTIVDYFPDALVLGVTATPVRGDGFGLGVDYGGVFESIVIGPQKEELIERGFLCRSVVYGPRKNNLDLTDLKIDGADFDQKELEKLVNKPLIIGDAVEHYTEICPGVPAVAFCASVAHAEHVAHEFRAAGYSAYSVDGTMDDTSITRILDGLGDGSVDVVTSCDLISEGLDIPAIICEILLRPTMSLSLYSQQVGRAARTMDGKDHCIILDHVNNSDRHGLPDINREWGLEGREFKKGKKEASSSRSVDRSSRVEQCKNCDAVHEVMPECPYCGHLKKAKATRPKTLSGKLVVLTEDVKIDKK